MEFADLAELLHGIAASALDVAPPSWRPFIELFALVVTTASSVALVIKQIVKRLPVPNAPDPKAGRVQWLSYWLLYLLDAIALNSERTETEAARVQRTKASKVPPPFPLLALAVVALSACTGAQARAAVTASNVVHDALGAVGDSIMRQALADEDAVLRSAKYRQDAETGLAKVRERWRPVESAYEKARVAQVALADAIQFALETRTKPPAQQALALLSAWQSMAGAAKAAGLELPSPPDALRALYGGVL